ncbi:MAG: SNF2-related protein, partial [Thermoleophilaceae bacterium]
MSDRIQEDSAAAGRVWLIADNPRDPELVFDFPFHEELNEAVKRLPRRWFDWRRKHWRVPADPRVGKAVEAVLGRFPDLVAEPEVLAWLADSERWRALVTVVSRNGGGAFVMRTISGDPPAELERAESVGEGRLVLPFHADNTELLGRLEGLQLDDLARYCARELRAGREPAAAELTLEIGEDGEPALTLQTYWDPAPARDYKRLPEAHPIPLHGRFFKRDGGWAIAVPGDPALAPAFADFIAEHPEVILEDRARDLVDELQDEHDRASETVALSYAEDAELDGLELGGELHPFQRAGVRYALARRRTFIADEQGLGKTVQALATLEVDEAFPAVVVCPASMKLTWERESLHWLPDRSVAVLDGRADAGWSDEAEEAEIVVLNYDILEAHLERLAARRPRAVVFDESHYVKNPGAARTKAALELAERLPDGALRLALTGTPVLNRAEELVAQ